MEFLAGLYTLLLVVICLLQALLLHRVIKDQAAVKLRDIAHRIHSFAGAGPKKYANNFSTLLR